MPGISGTGRLNIFFRGRNVRQVAVGAFLLTVKLLGLQSLKVLIEQKSSNSK